MTCFDGLYLKKYWYFIWAKRSTARRAVMVHSALLLASFDIAPSKSKKPSCIDWTIEISPYTRWFLLGLSPAFSSEPSRNPLILTSWYRPVVNTCSHFGTRIRRCHMPRGTARAAAGPSTFWRRESQWVSLRAASWSYWLHIVWRWLENARSRAESLEKLRFSQFLLSGSLRWSRSITRGFEFSAAHSVDPDDWLTPMKHLVETKSQFPCGILFLHFAQKQVRIWGRCISSIIGFRSSNFAKRNTLVHWNRINRHFGFWKKKYQEVEFQPLGNERTEWFHMHLKTTFFHLSDMN